MIHFFFVCESLNARSKRVPSGCLHIQHMLAISMHLSKASALLFVHNRFHLLFGLRFVVVVVAFFGIVCACTPMTFLVQVQVNSDASSSMWLRLCVRFLVLGENLNWLMYCCRVFFGDSFSFQIRSNVYSQHWQIWQHVYTHRSMLHILHCICASSSSLVASASENTLQGISKLLRRLKISAPIA